MISPAAERIYPRELGQLVKDNERVSISSLGTGVRAALGPYTIVVMYAVNNKLCVHRWPQPNIQRIQCFGYATMRCRRWIMRVLINSSTLSESVFRQP